MKLKIQALIKNIKRWNHCNTLILNGKKLFIDTLLMLKGVDGGSISGGLVRGRPRLGWMVCMKVACNKE